MEGVNFAFLEAAEVPGDIGDGVPMISDHQIRIAEERPIVRSFQSSIKPLSRAN
jgi:hypothetical protein